VTKEPLKRPSRVLLRFSIGKAEKVAQVCSVFEEERLEFDHDLYKLAAAAQIVMGTMSTRSEKTAPEEIDAAGRLMARSMPTNSQDRR